jgi:branched-chain amino acid transport system ATP-binding protein
MLVVEGLRKSFGGLVAVDGLDFGVARGTILGMIGINGAGKTTVMNCLNGIYRSDAGRVLFEGVDITHWTPHAIARAGIGRTFQVPRLFRRMTLIENLLVPMLKSGASDAALIERAEHFLTRVNLHALRHNFAEELSGGQQKLLELARVMMFEPKLILLDEPFAGVNPALCKLFIDEIETLLAAGTTFVLVSHDLTSIYRLSDHIIVLNQGQKIAEGTVEAIKRDPVVIEAYLGA